MFAVIISEYTSIYDYRFAVGGASRPIGFFGRSTNVLCYALACIRERQTRMDMYPSWVRPSTPPILLYKS